MGRSTGIVKSFDNVFVHNRSIQTYGYKQLTEGQKVEFLPTRLGKGWQAAEVAMLETA